MKIKLPRVKIVTAKGKQYAYFKTARTDNGKPVYIRLPEIGSPGFFASHASAMAGVQKKHADKDSVPDLIRKWQRSAEFTSRAANTQRLYDIYLKKFADDYPTAPAADIERKDIALMLDAYADRPGAADALRSTVASLYSWARSRGHVDNDPCKDISPVSRGEHLPWPEDLLEKALNASDAKVRLAVSLLYYTGLRIGDGCALKWSDIKDGIIYVTPEKTKNSTAIELEIPVHPKLQEVLDLHPRGLTTILAQKDGKRYSTVRIREIIQAWSPIHVVPHGLRKNAVIALLEAGCTVAQVASITGQSFNVVEYYARRGGKGKLAKQAMKLWVNK